MYFIYAYNVFIDIEENKIFLKIIKSKTTSAERNKVRTKENKENPCLNHIATLLSHDLLFRGKGSLNS